MEYLKGKQVSDRLIYLENPKRVLTRRVEKLKDALSKGLEDKTKNSRETSVRNTLYSYLKEKVLTKEASEITGIPEDKLKVSGPHKIGPDFPVYCGDEVVVIFETKTTMISDDYPDERIKEGTRQLRGYFTEDKWKGYDFSKAKYGIPIAIYLKDMDEMIKTGCENGIEYTLGDIVGYEKPRSQSEESFQHLSLSFSASSSERTM